jgi:hypothetical protein
MRLPLSIVNLDWRFPMTQRELAELQREPPPFLSQEEHRRLAQMATLMDELPDPNRMQYSCASSELFELVLAFRRYRLSVEVDYGRQG